MGTERDLRGVHATQASMEVTWGAGDVGPVQPGYESGDTDAMLNAFNRDTHRALADWVGTESWPGWFAQGLHAMPPNLRGYQAYEADRTRWVLEQPGGAERMEAAAARRLQRHADPDGARKLARDRPVVTASDLIRDRAERRQLVQATAGGGRGRRPRAAVVATASQSTTSHLASQRSDTVLLHSPEVSPQGQVAVGKGRDWGAEGAKVEVGAAGRKRKPSSKAAARQRKKQRAQQAMQEDSPERPACRPSGGEEGQVPPVVYPMDVG